MITKQELLANGRFQPKGMHSKLFYELKESSDGGYYITENYGDHCYGHHCNVRKITEKGIHVYTSIIGKSVNCYMPFADIISYPCLPIPQETLQDSAEKPLL